MEVGLTYDLRNDYPSDNGKTAPDSYGEFDSEETVKCLAAAIEKLGHRVLKIGNIQKLMCFLVQGGTVDLVFNIAEGLCGRSREAQVPAVLEAYHIPYTGSDPLTLALCLSKDMTKQVWRFHGLPTTDFCVVSNLDELERLPGPLPDFPLFVKPVHEGSSKGISSPDSIIESERRLYERVEKLLAWYRQPVLVEAYLPGREFTVAVLGSDSAARVLGAAEVVSVAPGGISGFADKETWEERVPDYYRPVQSAPLRDNLEALARQAYQAVHCRDLGRVDIRLDQDDNPQLMEINPLPALHPRHSAITFIGRQAGVSYQDLIAEILHQATARSVP